jgi:hypothetical protein
MLCFALVVWLLALCQEWARYERPPRWWRAIGTFLRQTHPSFTTRIVAINRALALEAGPAAERAGGEW